MQGLHLTADVSHCQCDAHWLIDAQRLGQACLAAVTQVGLRPVGHLFHTFAATAQGPGGVTATVLLAESHLCVHTWPETHSATLDVYVCNLGADHSPRARHLMALLLALLAPTHTQQHELWRGLPTPPAAPATPQPALHPISA